MRFVKCTSQATSVDVSGGSQTAVCGGGELGRENRLSKMKMFASMSNQSCLVVVLFFFPPCRYSSGFYIEQM